MSIELKQGTSSLKEIKERVKEIKVAFIIPGSPFLADERVFPFLAGPKLAAVLQENDNPVDLIDLAGFSNSQAIIGDYIKENDTSVFCMTATTPQIPSAILLRNKIKELKPNAKVILGGPHATLTQGALKKDIKAGRIGRGTADFQQLVELFDVIVAGDGEKAIFAAIDPLNDQKVIESEFRESTYFLQRGELEQHPHPARELIDMDSYHYYIDGHRAFSLIAQLGCPFECGFCGGRDVDTGRLIRTRTIENVIDEAEGVILASWKRAIESKDPAKALTAIQFYDDELNVSKDNLENLCRELIELQKKLAREISPEILKELNIKIEEVDGKKRVAMRFRGFVKAELFTQEQANLMYKAGFRILLTGVESGSDQILDTMKKHTSRKINSQCVEYAHNAGLKIKALMSIGHPGESEETVKESVEWAKTNLREGDEIDWTIITQYPGSPYYDHSVFVPEKNAWVYQIQNKKTAEVRNLWSAQLDYASQMLFYKGIPGEYTSYVWTDYLDPDDLVRLRDEAEKITREHLNLSPITSIAAVQFEHSMGQGLPSSILRKSKSV